MWTITKQFEFSASHQLRGLPETHPCSRIHGHNYTVEVELQSPSLDTTGFVLDYRKLGPFKQYLDTFVDHRHLNEVVRFNPTAENIAKWLHEIAVTEFGRLVRVTAVRVKETNKTLAEYRAS